MGAKILFWMALILEFCCIIALIAVTVEIGDYKALNFLGLQSVTLILFVAAAVARYLFKTEK